MVNDKKYKIITLTINPAIDQHIRLSELEIGSDNLGVLERRDRGGKGINVSRALLSLGLDSLALVCAGRENGEEFVRGLKNEGLTVDYCLVDGRVRENLNIHTWEGDTVIATAGPVLNEGDIASISLKLMAELDTPSIVVFSGRIAEGTDKELVIKMLLSAKEKGALLVLDSKSLLASDISRLCPLMIKPNIEEAEHLLSKKIKSPTESAKELTTLGAKYVLLTMGSDGLVLSDGKVAAFAPSVPVEVKSTVGAGDSTVASFIYSYIRGCSLLDTAVHASCVSAAACMTEGTLPPHPCEINRLLEQTKSTSQN